jgi:hypothetical protein
MALAVRGGSRSHFVCGGFHELISRPLQGSIPPPNRTMTLNFALLEMPDWLPFAIGGVVLVGIVMYINSILVRRRREALTAVSMEIGFNYEGDKWNNQLQAPPLETELFDKGHSKEFRNIMTGSPAGLRASLFDYKYTVGSGRYAHTYAQTVASYANERFSVPKFEMRPRGIWQKITDVFIGKNIDFESHPSFSRRYRLRGPDIEKTRVLFTPALLSFLESLDPTKKWRLEGIGNTLLIYRSSKRVKPADFRTFLEETSSIASQFFSTCGCRKSS